MPPTGNTISHLCGVLRSERDPHAFISTSFAAQRASEVFRLSTRPLLIIPHLWLSRSTSFPLFTFLLSDDTILRFRPIGIFFYFSFSSQFLLSKEHAFRRLVDYMSIFRQPARCCGCENTGASEKKGVPAAGSCEPVDVAFGLLWRCSGERLWGVSFIVSYTYVYSCSWLHIARNSTP